MPFFDDTLTPPTADDTAAPIGDLMAVTAHKRMTFKSADIFVPSGATVAVGGEAARVGGPNVSIAGKLGTPIFPGDTYRTPLAEGVNPYRTGQNGVYITFAGHAAGDVASITLWQG